MEQLSLPLFRPEIEGTLLEFSKEWDLSLLMGGVDLDQFSYKIGICSATQQRRQLLKHELYCWLHLDFYDSGEIQETRECLEFSYLGKRYKFFFKDQRHETWIGQCFDYILCEQSMSQEYMRYRLS